MPNISSPLMVSSFSLIHECLLQFIHSYDCSRVLPIFIVRNRLFISLIYEYNLLQFIHAYLYVQEFQHDLCLNLKMYYNITEYSIFIERNSNRPIHWRVLTRPNIGYPTRLVPCAEVIKLVIYIQKPADECDVKNQGGVFNDYRWI